MWNENILGEDSPDKLRNTVLFLIGMNVGLRAGDEHYALRRDSESKPSQISSKTDSKGMKCMLYTEDTMTKANDGGLKHMRNECKTVWVYPSKNVNRCPIHIIEKYMKLLPPVTPQTKKFNFYLRGLERYTPTQWYGEHVVGLNSLGKKSLKKC